VQATDMVLSQQTYTYTNSSGIYFDELHRGYDVTDLAGRKTQYRFEDCCGLNYAIDADGAKTYTIRDSVSKRQLGTKNLIEVVGGIERFIQTTNKFDPVGAVLETMRVGTNGSVITLGKYGYDVLGRVIRSTNALGGITTNLFAVVGNQLQEITLNSDGGTRTNQYYRDGRLEKITGTAVHGIKYLYGIIQEGGQWRNYTKEIKLDTAYADTSEWTTNYQDGVGRSYKTVFAASSTFPYQETSYNSYGQVRKIRDPDGVTNLFSYHSNGEREYTAVDLNHNDTIDTSGPDRVTKSERSFVEASGGDLVRNDTYVWDTDTGGPVLKLVSRHEVSVDGLKTWSAVFPDGSDVNSAVVTRSETQLANSGNNWTRTETTWSPDGTSIVSVYDHGRLVQTLRYDASPAQIGRVDFGYDSHGRRNSTTDIRNGTTSHTFNDADQIVSVTTPNPDVLGAGPQTTTTYYNKMLQVTNTISADGGSVTNEYYRTGELKRQYGARMYPVAYSYDHAGRMKTMTNWSSFSISGAGTGARVTTWNYNQYRGWLDSKDYPDASSGNPGTTGADYTYTPGGRLKTRTWARVGTSSQRIVATYKYGFDDSVSDNHHGDLTETSYAYDPQSTPTVTTVYDRRGRVETRTQGGITTTLAYNDANQTLSESYEGSGTTLEGLSVTNGYDQFLRRTNLTALNGSTVLSRATNSYDIAGRLLTVSDGTRNATYTYLANSRLVEQILFKENTTPRLTTTRKYDKLDRLHEVENLVGGTPEAAADYGYNNANQRTRVTLADGSYWLYEYDKLGQVQRGAKYFADGMPVPGQQFNYSFDDIGNRVETRSGGDEAGMNQRTNIYTSNKLNQYSQRTIPGYVEVSGLGMANNSTIAVNGYTPWRKGEFFRKELSVANSAGSVWLDVAVTATGETVPSGKIFIPKNPEKYVDDPTGTGYDADGNLGYDGRWVYTWDAENRLIRMVSRSDAPSGSERRIEFEYDWMGRRIGKKVWNNTAGTGSPNPVRKFIYDGWNLIAALDGSSAVKQSYLWGMDLSGSMQGAGGVGGLLAINDDSLGGHFCAYDGNGNVTGLVKASDPTVITKYEYGPFGELIRASGAMAKANPFRFSTKYQDEESDYLYYGYRAYNPSVGRWLNRDPIEEEGGLNLYGMLDNDPVNYIDLYGLAMSRPLQPPQPPPTLPLRKPIPEKERACCDDRTVKKGEDELKNRYKKATDAAKKLGLKPASPPPWGSGPATCKNSSLDVLEYLVPTPSCWQCYLEERNYYSPAKDPKDDRRDHQVVICVGYFASGAKKEIIFDWWGDTKHGDNQSGGPPDKFRKEYRYPQKNTENPYWTKCSDGNPNETPPPCSGWQCSRPPVYQ